MELKLINLIVVIVLLNEYCVSVTLDEDPSLWPGHLQPFGTLQNIVNVKELTHWPSPTGKKLSLFHL